MQAAFYLFIHFFFESGGGDLVSEVKKEGRGALIIYIHNWKPFFKKDAHVDFNLQASFFFFSFFLLFVLGFPSLAIIYIGIHMKKRKKKKKKKKKHES